MNNEQKIAITCKDVHKYFGVGGARVHALRGVNLDVNYGELRMLMGPSGSGKTTLISIIAAILTQDQGECLVAGKDLNHLPDQEKTYYRGHHIGFVFQSFNLIPMLTTEENVSIPLLLKGVEQKEALEKAKILLKEVGLEEKIGAYPPQLSGGQQQRVAISRALVHDPDLIVCDEPTSFLDHVTGQKIMELLREMINKKKVTVIVVTHDPRIVPFADKIDHLEDGKIVNHQVN